MGVPSIGRISNKERRKIARSCWGCDRAGVDGDYVEEAANGWMSLSIGGIFNEVVNKP
jgi:hypothetical protein